MTTSLLEIIECSAGEFILKRADEDAKPLVTIKFSAEARSYMTDNGSEIARAMIQAAFQAVAVSSEQVEVDTGQATPPILH